MSDTVVIGAGLSGLARAHALAARGEDVLLLEASGRAGGVVRTERHEGFLVELGPNTVRPTEEIWRLVEELGLASEVLLADPRAPRYVDFAGKLHRLPMSPRELWTTRLLSPAGKARALLEPFIRPAARTDESVSAFFARRLGAEVAQRLVEPFVSGIWAGDASRLSASASFPSLWRWEREHGSLARGALAQRGRRGPGPRRRGLLSFREGLESLPFAFARNLGTRLRLSTAVRKISRPREEWQIQTPEGAVGTARVVVATPALEAARLVEELSPGAARALAEIPHSPLAVLHLAWKSEALPSPLQGFGHLVVPQDGRRILGAVWSSALFPGRAPAGWLLLTVFLGGARDTGVPSLSNEELAQIAARDLEASLGLPGRPRLLAVTRYPRAIPQYDFGHEARMRVLAETESAWPGLSFLGNYRGGVSVGDVVRNALAL